MILKGISASSGIAIGQAMTISDIVKYETYKIKPSEIKKELIRLEVAILTSKRQLQDLQFKAEHDGIGGDKGAVFQAHTQLLEDPLILSEIIQKIHEEPLNIETIIDNVFGNFISKFTKMQDEYMKERAIDILDVRDRLLKNLLGITAEKNPLQQRDCACIIVAKNLTPSQLVYMDKSRILGIAIEEGGLTSHVVLFARSLDIPTLVGVKDLMEVVANGEEVILDGIRGTLETKISKAKVTNYRKIQKSIEDSKQKLETYRKLKAITLDKHKISMGVNISFPSDTAQIKAYGADRVGLFRTEFLYMGRDNLPNEEEQFEAYKEVARACKGEVIIRTFDLGGDKNLPYLDFPKETNPFLGWRSIRVALDLETAFRDQLRAILRASHYGNVKILYPMITSIHELDRCYEILGDIKNDLRKKGIPFNEEIENGVLIEVPAAVEILDFLAEKVDFLSIGTNDLVQFILGVDRANERISSLYEPLHPGVLRILKRIVDSAAFYGIPLGICGEMARNHMASIILIGMGLTNLSMNGPSIPGVKRLIRKISYAEAKEISEKVLLMSSAEQIKAFLKPILEKLRAEED